jgi:hypothetical protein
MASESLPLPQYLAVSGVGTLDLGVFCLWDPLRVGVSCPSGGHWCGNLGVGAVGYLEALKAAVWGSRFRLIIAILQCRYHY